MRFILLSVLTVALFLVNIFFGAIHIDAGEVLAILTGGGEGNEALRFIVLESRLPQAVTATLAGAGLAATGLMLQTGFRNPLAGPSVLGITSGASLGVALVMLLFGGTVSVGAASIGGGAAAIGGALAGSVAVMGLLILMSARIRSNLMLLITGMMTGYLASSLVTLLSSLSDANGIQGYVMWGMGTFGGVTMSTLPWFAGITLAGILIAMLLAKPLNLLLLGDNYARNLGVNVRRARNMILISTGLLCAIITAYCGPIGFIGLAIPHIARMIFRTDNHLILMPATILTGAIVALGCNILSVVPDNHIIPINALTPVIGVPVVLYVILRRKSA